MLKKAVIGVYGLLAFIMLSVFLLIAYLPIVNREYEVKKVSFVAEKGDVVISADVADTEAKRILGLMNRTFLEENRGMLFVFEGEQIRNFWMKNTLLPLDMIFISANMEIVNIQKQAQPCKVFACDIYSSGKPAKYVVEVNGGFADRNGIMKGQKVEFSL